MFLFFKPNSNYHYSFKTGKIFISDPNLTSKDKSEFSVKFKSKQKQKHGPLDKTYWS